MSSNADFIWLDGEFVPWHAANIHVLTHGLHYGGSVFEGLRSYLAQDGVAIFRLECHTRRFLNSAKIINLPIPYSLEELMHAQLEVIAKNKLKNAYIRPIAFYDASSTKISAPTNQVKVAIAAWEFDNFYSKQQLIKAQVSSFTRHFPNSIMCKAKISGPYINSTMAAQQAQLAGYDEAILLDTNGFVAEASVANIFLYIKQQLHTPTLSNCLAGITRESIITLAQDLGIEVIERVISRDELYIADEIFITGTAAEVKAIVAVDNRQVGNGQLGPICAKLQQIYSDAVRGINAQYNSWLSYL
jgi:branched-chain amino acid aminotransferase